jgi:hypothetical protein
METVTWFEPEADPRLAALAESLELLPDEQRESSCSRSGAT